jgi:hypothetical protein
MTAHQTAHDAAANAGLLLAQRVMGLLVDKGVLSNEEVRQMLVQCIEAYQNGGPTNKATGMLFQQILTYYETAAGMVEQ